VGSVDELLAECDAVLLCSLDGRPHREQFRACAAGRPVFVDKPVAASLRDAAEIFRIAEETGTPVFSASALRFAPEVIEVALAEVGRVAGAIAHGPCPLEPHHPDLFFYGIHATEALLTVMGPGCVSVARVTTERASVVNGVWTDGSVGTLYAMHHWPAPYRVIKLGDRSVSSRDVPADYVPLLREVVRFCRSGIPPVSKAQTLEICAFMEAADESRRRDGSVVTLDEMMGQAT
jgi:predicted dehydrogenase